MYEYNKVIKILKRDYIHEIAILTCVQLLVLSVEPAPPLPIVMLTFIRGSTSKLPKRTKPAAPPRAAPLPPPPPNTSTFTRCTPHGTMNTPDEVNTAKLGGRVFCNDYRSNSLNSQT